MSEHLSSEQILESVGGECPADWARHLGDCAQCSGEVARWKESLGMFRAAVRETAANLEGTQRVFRLPERSHTARKWLTASMAVAAALAILVWLPIYKSRENEQKAAEIARQDAALMAEIETELSSGVATPMKPLEKMVGWTKDGQIETETREF